MEASKDSGFETRWMKPHMKNIMVSLRVENDRFFVGLQAKVDVLKTRFLE
jgi:hypothetical protein